MGAALAFCSRNRVGHARWCRFDLGQYSLSGVGAAGVSLAMASGASASLPPTNIPSQGTGLRIILGEEEISDVSLAAGGKYCAAALLIEPATVTTKLMLARKTKSP